MLPLQAARPNLSALCITNKVAYETLYLSNHVDATVNRGQREPRLMQLMSSTTHSFNMDINQYVSLYGYANAAFDSQLFWSPR
jgi:hypothetical protein